MSNPKIYLATPNYKPWYHREYMFGCLDATHELPGLTVADRGLFPDIDEGLYVCDRRDRLTHRFLLTGADYILWVDSDTGWRAADVKALLAADKDVIQATYFWKDDTATMVGVPIGGVDGNVQPMQSVGSGFLLCTRESMVRACAQVHERRHLFKYQDLPGIVVGLWQPKWTEGVGHCKDDGAFSLHCQQAGVKMWRHTGVVVTHYGEKGFRGEPVPWSGQHALPPDHRTNPNYQPQGAAPDSAGTALEPGPHSH